MKEFDFIYNDLDFNSDNKISGKSLSLSNKNKMKLVSRLDSLKEIMPDINKEESIHLISSDNFGSIELFKLLNQKYSFNEILITTWSYNQDFIDFISTLNCNICFFVDKSIKTRKSHLYAQLINLLDTRDNFQVKIHHMLHSKVTLLTDGNIYLSVETSANYSNNQRIENYTITESKQLFIFHKNWMNEIIEKDVQKTI
jgi:hypothetical protein